LQKGKGVPGKWSMVVQEMSFDTRISRKMIQRRNG
jgi:hypothetical protein